MRTGKESVRLELAGGGDQVWPWYGALQKWEWEWMFTDWITPLPPSGRYSMRCITAAWDFSGYWARPPTICGWMYTSACPSPRQWMAKLYWKRYPTVPAISTWSTVDCRC